MCTRLEAISCISSISYLYLFGLFVHFHLLFLATTCFYFSKARWPVVATCLEATFLRNLFVFLQFCIHICCHFLCICAKSEVTVVARCLEVTTRSSIKLPMFEDTKEKHVIIWRILCTVMFELGNTHTGLRKQVLFFSWNRKMLKIHFLKMNNHKCVRWSLATDTRVISDCFIAILQKHNSKDEKWHTAWW